MLHDWPGSIQVIMMTFLGVNSCDFSPEGAIAFSLKARIYYTTFVQNFAPDLQFEQVDASC